MAEVPRGKGSFSQPSEIKIFPVNATHDGCIDCDTVYQQADYPVLFEIIGIDYNEAGDDNATEFRTPKAPSWATSDPGWVPRIRF